MKRGRPKAELVLTDDERAQLTSFARSRSLPASLSARARIILSSAEGVANSSIAERLELGKATVGKWRARFIERRIAGLYDDVRPGPPRSIDDERVASLIKTTLHTKPANGATHWSVRSVAAQTGISKSSVQRYFQLFGLQPHRTEGFKLSNDPFFVEKLRDVVGLYLSPPENALVLCVDEKSQCQALERTQPMLPMGFGYVEGVTHDYKKRHGTTTLFAALNVLNGAVLATCKPRHRHQEFLSFLREIDAAVPAELDVHCIVGNYATHSHPKVKAWLTSRPRWHMHFIPTYSSWLNQIERFFALITDKAIRRGSFTSVKQLVQRIDQFVTHHNACSQPFRWTATADSILEKLHRLCSRISGTGHKQLAQSLPSLWRQEFESLSHIELSNLLDGALYGYHGDIELEDDRTADQCRNDWDRYGMFNFPTNWGEQFDRDGKSFMISPLHFRTRSIRNVAPVFRVERGVTAQLVAA